MPSRHIERVALIDGVRTPFVKQATAFTGISALQMGQWVVNELFLRSELSPADIELLVFGQVIQTPKAPNIAREIVLATQLDNRTDAFSVSKACTTSLQSVASVAEAILSGRVSCGIAGGSDSASVLPIQVSDPMAQALLLASKERHWHRKPGLFRKLNWRDLLPQPPAIAEYSTGLTMGQSAEQMAKKHRIGRYEQEQYAMGSHQKAHAAWEAGLFNDEVIPCYVAGVDKAVVRDNCIRSEFDPQRMARLPTVFDRKNGSITSATSCPLTDGAAALLMMSESRAKALKQPVMAYIRGMAFSAAEVSDDLLAGPAYAIPKVLRATGLTLDEIDIVEIHEAFAAQLLVNLKLLASDDFARTLGYDKAPGEIDPERLNRAGGSLALGHPFAATGARLLMQAARALQRSNGRYALVSACAAGGLGAAFIIEVA